MSGPLPPQDDEIEPTELKKPKARSHKKRKIDTDLAAKNKLLKGIILSSTKPSYSLQRGRGTSNTEFESLRWLNRNRLSCIMRKLMRRRNWDEVSGVLSVILNGTCTDKSVNRNRIKYLVSWWFHIFVLFYCCDFQLFVLIFFVRRLKFLLFVIICSIEACRKYLKDLASFYMIDILNLRDYKKLNLVI